MGKKGMKKPAPAKRKVQIKDLKAKNADKVKGGAYEFNRKIGKT
jgi:hypothetical protein